MKTKTQLFVVFARQFSLPVKSAPVVVATQLPTHAQLLGTPQVWRPRVGPKATGKTDLFVALARQFGIPAKPAPVVVAPQVPTSQVWRPRIGPKSIGKTDLFLRLGQPQ